MLGAVLYLWLGRSNLKLAIARGDLSASLIPLWSLTAYAVIKLKKPRRTGFANVYCTACGKEVPAQAKFCPACGTTAQTALDPRKSPPQASQGAAVPLQV